MRESNCPARELKRLEIEALTAEFERRNGKVETQEIGRSADSSTNFRTFTISEVDEANAKAKRKYAPAKKKVSASANNRAQIDRLYAQGLDHEAILLQVDASSGYVERRIKQLERDSRGGLSLSEWRKNETRRLAADGVTPKQISEDLKIHYCTVIGYLKKPYSLPGEVS